MAALCWGQLCLAACRAWAAWLGAVSKREAAGAWLRDRVAPKLSQQPQRKVLLPFPSRAAPAPHPHPTSPIPLQAAWELPGGEYSFAQLEVEELSCWDTLEMPGGHED